MRRTFVSARAAFKTTAGDYFKSSLTRLNPWDAHYFMELMCKLEAADTRLWLPPTEVRFLETSLFCTDPDFFCKAPEVILVPRDGLSLAKLVRWTMTRLLSRVPLRSRPREFHFVWRK